MDEMNITPFSASRPQRLFEAVAWSESTICLLQRNNIFNEATSSRLPQLSIQRAPHDVISHPPHLPHPPSLYHNDVYSIGSRLRVPGSPGEPPALSLYIYTYMYIYTYIYMRVCVFVFIISVVSSFRRQNAFHRTSINTCCGHVQTVYTK